MKSFYSTLKKFNSPLWTYHLEIPEEIALELISGKDRRVVCTLNDKKKFQCALMPDGDHYWFININKRLRDTLKLQVGEKINVKLEKDNSEYGLPVTEELKELLDQDQEGNSLFHSLTPGKQRNLIYIAGQVKNPAKRLTRALVIVNHLKIHNGQINFKALNQELKTANNKFNC